MLREIWAGAMFYDCKTVSSLKENLGRYGLRLISDAPDPEDGSLGNRGIVRISDSKRRRSPRYHVRVSVPDMDGCVIVGKQVGEWKGYGTPADPILDMGEIAAYFEEHSQELERVKEDIYDAKLVALPIIHL